MKSGIRTIQFLSGLLLCFVTLFFLIMIFFATLSTGIVTKSVIIWIFISLFLILLIEASLYWMTESLKIKEENMQDLRKKNIISQGASAIALFFRYSSVKNSILGILMFLAFIAGAIYYIIIPGINKGLIFSVQFYVLVGVFAVYFLILRRFVMKALLQTEKFSRKQLPVCSIEKDGVIFNLPFKKGKIAIVALIGFIAGIAAVIFGKIGLTIPLYISIGIFVILFFVMVFGGKKSIVYYPVKIKFSEIEEIKSMSFIEAQSLLNYKIGPDVTLQIQSVRDMIKFLKDPTNPKNRPNAYTLDSYASGAKTIMIKGPNLFYIIAIGNEDADKLVKEIKKQI